MVTGDHEVMHHRALRRGDRRRMHQLTLCVQNVVRHVRSDRRITEEMQLVRLGAQLRVRRERSGQLASEVVATHGFEFARQFPREVPLFERPDTTRVSENVGVRSTCSGIEHAVRIHRFETLFVLRGAHIAIAVPLRLTAFETNPVNHSVAEEPMVGVAGLRIRPVANVHPAQALRNRSGDPQIRVGHFFRHGRIVAPQEPWLAAIGRSIAQCVGHRRTFLSFPPRAIVTHGAVARNT